MIARKQLVCEVIFKNMVEANTTSL